MSKVMLRAGFGLLAVILVVTQAAGCVQPGDTQSALPDPSTDTPAPSSTTQSAYVSIPPSVSTTTASSPTFIMPTSATVIPTNPGSNTSEPLTSTTVTPADTTDPATTVIAPPDGAEKTVVSDPRNDIFDDQAQPFQAESYLDIVGAEIYSAGTESFFRIMLVGAVPFKTDSPDLVLEWGFYIDADMSPATGLAGDIFANDIGPDYLLRLAVTPHQGTSTTAEIYDLITKKLIGSAACLIEGSTISFSVPVSTLALGQFDFTAVACKWQDGELVAADKAPNQGHYNVSKGYVYIKPGLPTQQMTTTYATVWYNEGNKERAQLCAEAFEAAYVDVARILRPPAQSRTTIYVYVSQSDLEEGLRVFSELSSDEASVYHDAGSPRPSAAHGIVHIPPDFDWRAIYHQQVLDAMDRLC